MLLTMSWKRKCGLNDISQYVYLTSTEDRAKNLLFQNTRYPKYPMILKKNRVWIGYCQKLSGRVGYRVPVSHWLPPLRQNSAWGAVRGPSLWNWVTKNSLWTHSATFCDKNLQQRLRKWWITVKKIKPRRRQVLSRLLLFRRWWRRRSPSRRQCTSHEGHYHSTMNESMNDIP